MQTDCISLENGTLRLEIAQSIGPRILGLSLDGSPNLLAELPDFTALRPDGKIYNFHGGHRFWCSPEDAILTYELEDFPVEIVKEENGLKVTKSPGIDSGMEKTIQVTLPDRTATAIITHQLKNCTDHPMHCAPWAITQFRTGGAAILPMMAPDAGFLPNCNLVLWSYTDMTDPNIHWGRNSIRLDASMRTPFKVGFANHVGWLAYWLEGVLFVKFAAYDSRVAYPDYGCSSECYCNNRFIELETLGPLQELLPGGRLEHVETWHLFHAPVPPQNEAEVQCILDQDV